MVPKHEQQPNPTSSARTWRHMKSAIPVLCPTLQTQQLFFVFCKLTNSYTALKQLNSLCEFIKISACWKNSNLFFEYVNWMVEFCISPGHSPRLEQNSHADQREQVAGRVQPCHFLRKTKHLASGKRTHGRHGWKSTSFRKHIYQKDPKGGFFMIFHCYLGFMGMQFQPKWKYTV